MARRNPAYTVRGDVIRAIRVRKHHWTQDDLARESGLQPGTISRIESGVNQGQLHTISRIASALGCDPDILIDWGIELPPDS
jgi:transcriptional regulator with XRE-family HTH domain